MSDKLALDYLKRFRSRVKAIHVYFNDQNYSDVIRESQEALELLIKAPLRQQKVQPEHSHDPGKQLALYVNNLDPAWKTVSQDLIQWSKRLRKEREFAFNGAEDFIPSEEYSKADAKEIIDFLEKLLPLTIQQP